MLLNAGSCVRRGLVLTSLACLLVSGCDKSPNTNPTASNPAPAPPPKPTFQFPIDKPLIAEPVEVLWALWGNWQGNAGHDATTFVRDVFARTGGFVFDDPAANRAVGDPMPGKRKSMTIAFKLKSRTIVAVIDEHCAILFKTPPDRLAPHDSKGLWPDHEIQRANAAFGSASPNQTAIVWSRWGADGPAPEYGWVEVNDPMSQRLAAHEPLSESRFMGGATDPAPGKQKELYMLLAVDGQPISARLLHRGSLHVDAGDRVNKPAFLANKPAPPPPPPPPPPSIIARTLEGIGEVTAFTTSKDGKHAYVLEANGQRLLRVDPSTMTITGEIKAGDTGLHPHYTCLLLTPAGDTLYLGGAAETNADAASPRDRWRGYLAEVDAAQFKMRGSPKAIRSDLKAMGFLSPTKLVIYNERGGENESSDVVDLNSGVITASGHLWSRKDEFIVLDDGKRILISDHNGLGCRVIDVADSDKEWSRFFDATYGPVQVDGPFTLLDDGRYAIGQDGSLVRISQNLQRTFLGVKKLAINAGAQVSKPLGLIALSTKGGLQLLAWPALTPIGERENQGVLRDLTLHPDGKTLLARWLPQGRLEGPGDIKNAVGAKLVAIDLSKLLPPNYKPAASEITPINGEAGHPIVRTLPLRSDIIDLVMPESCDAMYALDSAAGSAVRIDPATLQLSATSGVLPPSANALCTDPDGKWLAVASYSTYLASNKEKEGGVITFLDPKTLAPAGPPMKVIIDPGEIAISSRGRLYIAGGSNQHTHIIEYDLKSKSRHEIGRTSIYNGASIALSADASTLYHTTRGLSPASLTALRIAGTSTLKKPTTLKIDNADHHAGGGKIWLLGDNAHAVTAGGDIYSLRGPGNSVVMLANEKVFSGAAGANRMLITCDDTNTLKVRSLPSLEPQASFILNGTLSNFCLNPKSDRLYGVYRAGARVELGERYTGAILGDVVEIDLKVINPD